MFSGMYVFGYSKSMDGRWKLLDHHTIYRDDVQCLLLTIVLLYYQSLLNTI